MKEILTTAAGMLIALLVYQVYLGIYLNPSVESQIEKIHEDRKEVRIKKITNSKLNVNHRIFSRLRSQLISYIGRQQNPPEFISDFGCWKCSNTKDINTRYIDNRIYIINNSNHYISINLMTGTSGSTSLSCSYNNKNWERLHEIDNCNYEKKNMPRSALIDLPFSCSKTITETEYHICNSDRLLALEIQTDKAYRTKLELATPKIKDLNSSIHERFQMEREDQCIEEKATERKIFKCIESLTKKRLLELKSG